MLRIRLLSLLLISPALALALPACEKEEGGGATTSTTPVRPPVVLDEETMTRLIDAMRALQDLSRTHPEVRAQGREAMPIGVGVTELLGEPAVRIVKEHGFASAREFESKLGYMQAALMQLQFGGRHGFDGEAQLYRLRGKKTDLEARRREIERDAELSDDTRRLMLAEVRLQLQDVEDRIREVNDFAETMDRQYDRLPDENLASVRAHLDELLPLIAPDGTLSTAAPVATPGIPGDAPEDR